MTIKEFSRLCGCNPQTLRYYDHMDLLKPVKVDQWSGYRFYEEELALLNRNVDRSGLSKEASLRSLITGKSLQEKPLPEFYGVLKNLREINTSLNQIAAKANAMNLIDTPKYWANVSELQKVIGKLMEEAYR